MSNCFSVCDFAGTIGPSRDLDFLVKVAEKVSAIPEIYFLMVGDGVEKARLELLVKQRGLLNVRFHFFVAEEQYPTLVREANVGLACLRAKTARRLFPARFRVLWLFPFPFLHS